MTLELTVKTEDAGTRLDAFIAAHAPELTRSQAARLIEEAIAGREQHCQNKQVQ